MSAQGLGSRAIIGEFFLRLEAAVGMGWIGAVSMLMQSDQASETYKWLGQSPAMREWIGGRNAKGFRENGLTIENLHFEATIAVLVKEARRDKTGQIMLRIRELADRTETHWASLLSTLIAAGESGVCYDGQFFFDTDHSEGDSGAQSNDIAVDISTLPTANHGSVTEPSIGEMNLAIRKGISQIYGFVDDQGEPMNEMAQQFMVMAPNSLADIAAAAVTSPIIDSGEANPTTRQSAYKVDVVGNVRLDSAGWTDQFAVFRTDGNAKPFIRQEEEAVDLDAVAEGSEHEFKHAEWLFGVDAERNVGYGYWQHANLVTMV